MSKDPWVPLLIMVIAIVLIIYVFGGPHHGLQ